MKLKTQMQKCKILTCQEGILQAQNNGVLYQEFVPSLEKYTFAGNAKQIFEAMAVLEPGFLVSIDTGMIILYDSQQEIRVALELPDELAKVPVAFGVEMAVDIIGKLKALRSYITADFPGYSFTEGRIEALHPSMIVRADHNTSIRGMFSVDNLPAACTGVVETEEGLWLKYGDAYICLGRLDIAVPDTSAYTTEGLLSEEIPEIIKERWVACTDVRWDSFDLCLLPHSRIENIQGRGEYDGKLFEKIIKNAKLWSFENNLLHFAGTHYTGVLENVKS